MVFNTNQKGRRKTKVFVSIVLVALFVLSGVLFGAVYQSSPILTQNNNANNSTATPSASSGNGTIYYGLETSLVQSSLNWFSPVESYYFISMLYLPFASYQFPPEPYLNPVLASGWTHNAAYTSWNLSLKPNLKWDNGSPLNSTDLWFNLALYNQTGELNMNVTKISIVNSTTVNVQMSSPEPNFVTLWVTYTNSYLVPYQVYHKFDPTVNDTNISCPAYTSSPYYKQLQQFTNYNNIIADGPFTFTNYTAGANPLIFTANKYFYRGLPHMNVMSVRIFSSVSSMSAAMRSGEIDAMWDMGAYNTIVQPNFVGIPGSSEYEVEPGPYMMVCFNMHQWPYNTTQFRMAMAYITNRTAIDSVVNSASGTLVGYNMLTSALDQSIGINPSSVANYTLNYGKAEQLLSEIGIQMDNNSASPNYGLYVYNNSNLPDYGQPVTINITTTQLGFGDLSTAVELSNEWEAFGFKVSITSLSSDAFYPLVEDSATGWSTSVTIDYSGYYPGALTNMGSITEFNNATAYKANYAPSFGMPNFNASKISALANASYHNTIDTTGSNNYAVQLSSYIQTVVPFIPLWVNYNWLSVSNSFYWGNQTNHSGIFNTQALVQPDFWYGALWVVHPLSSNQPTTSPNDTLLYLVIGVVVAVVVIGSVVGVLSSSKRKKQERKEDAEDKTSK